MTYLVERLAELRRYLDHLKAIRPRVTGREQDLSLTNDVLFSLFTVCQLVIDVAGKLSARRGDHEDAANSQDERCDITCLPGKVMPWQAVFSRPRVSS